MTKINKLVLHGFKSFAKRTEILFDDSFNCVVGPNGSGKSNVLDAICFVLGKSSAKGLRAEKSSNLVFNGGKGKKPAKEGKVSIYFDNSTGTFPTEEKVVKVTRIVKQTGSSTYKINDKTRTRTQVLDLLAIAKINPDGYNIILQGDVIKFVELSTVEKRKLIEEIAGISIFEEKKDKASRELDKVDNKLGEAEIILKERKSYLKDLKGERDQALKYKELNDKIRQNKASYLKKRIDRNDDARTKLEERIKVHKEKFDKHENKIKEYKEHIEKNRAEIREISKEVEQKGEKDQVKLQKEIEDIRIEIATNKTKITSHENEIVRIKQRKEQLSVNLKDIEGKLKEFEDKKETLAQRKERREKEKAEIEEKIATFKKKHKLDKDTEDLDKRVDEIDEQSEVLQVEIQKMKESQQELIRQQDRVNYEIKTLDERIEKVQEIADAHKKELDELKHKRKRFKTITLELNKKLDQSSIISAELSRADTKLQITREDLAKLETRNATIKEKVAGSIAVQKILEQKKNIPGIYGTVAELGSVKSKYALALETAAGPRVRSIVVKDDAVAARCIKYLKSNKLGTATFIPLNKIKPSDDDAGKFKNAGGSSGRALDLIKYDGQYAKAFRYVFGNTIVVDSIDAARRIGVGNIRMATLTGDLVEISGAMQGGFRGQQKKGAAFKEDELTSSIERREEEVAELQNTLDTYRKRRSENDDEIARLREEKANLEGDIIKIEKGLHLDSADLDATMASKEKLNEQGKMFEEQMDDVITKVSLKNRDLAKLKVERQQIKSKLTELRNPRLLAELNTFDQRKQELTEEIIKLSAEVEGVDTQMKSILGRDHENSMKVIKDIEKEETKFTQEIEDFAKKIKTDEKDLKSKEANLEKFYKQFKGLFARRSKMNNEIMALERKINDEVDKSRKVELQINTISLEVAKHSAELSTLAEEYKEYEGVELNLKKSEEELKKEINSFERMRENIGNVNLRALEIYDSVEKEYTKLCEKRDALTKEKDDVLMLIAEIEGKKKERFMESLNVVNDHFTTIFGKLSTKGEAYLEVENPENPFEGGLLVRVKISGSKFMDLRSLSGGEKTLTALAFIFAIQECEPGTFYVLDEVDAALDKRNAEKLSELIEQYSERAQYVVISHNDAVIHQATTLYGVSMDSSSISKVVSIKI